MYYKGYIAIDKNVYEENKNFLDLYLLRKHVNRDILSKSYLSPIGSWQESNKWMLLPFEAEKPDVKRNSIASLNRIKATYVEIYYNPLDILRDEPYSGYYDFKKFCLSNIGKIWLKYIEYDQYDAHLWLVQGRVDNFYDISLGLDNGEVRELSLSKKNIIEYGITTGYNLNNTDSRNEFINLINDYMNSIDHDYINVDSFVNYVIEYARNNSEAGYILDSDIDLQDLLHTFRYSI